MRSGMPVPERMFQGGNREKIINNADNIVGEMADGIALAYPEYVRRVNIQAAG